MKRILLAAAVALCATQAHSAGYVGIGYDPSGLVPCTDAITSARATNCTLTPIPGRDFNISAWGTFVASYQLERSFDSGVTWLPITAAGTQLYVWTLPASETDEESESGVKYRLNVTSYTSGTVNVRLSQ